MQIPKFVFGISVQKKIYTYIRQDDTAWGANDLAAWKVRGGGVKAALHELRGTLKMALQNLGCPSDSI